jgi:acid phosphatase
VEPHDGATSLRPVPLAFVRLAAVTLLSLFMLLWGCAGREVAVPKGIEQVQHVIVIYMENLSFNGQFGLFPGANGIVNAGDAIRQVRKDGSPYTTLPQPLFNGQLDSRIPADLPVRPFNLAPYVPPEQLTSSPVHLFYQEQYQINGSRMNKFVAWNDAGGDHGGLAMSYYDVTNMPVWMLARQYTLCDNLFHSAFGGSWLNHVWLVSAARPTGRRRRETCSRSSTPMAS